MSLTYGGGESCFDEKKVRKRVGSPRKLAWIWRDPEDAW
jgi:hypothetical protein